ncbi:MAG: DUF4835 family protein [Ignavibacteriae bacterium]|nr:DUF4835 family protein [Ignavibacteriota bacterium]
MKTIALLSFGLLCLLSLPSVAQEQVVEATATINSERLSLALRDEVAGFANELERYVNETRWVSEGWEGTPIRIDFSVAFSSGSADGSFRVSLAVVSQRDVYLSDLSSPLMRVLDEKWNFTYVRNQQFQQNTASYDAITSVIDFYVYVALGLDLDTYGYLGGNEMYERAMQIARRGELETSAGRTDGWSANESAGAYSRLNMIRELTTPRFEPIRKFMLNYHYNGMDRLSEYPDAALDSLSNYITNLMFIKDDLVSSSTLIRVINDTKHFEFAQIFTGYEDKTIWQKLLYIDPTHQSVYDEAMNK